MEGNRMKIREALLFVKQYFDKIDPFNPNTYTFAQIEVDHIRDAISAALSVPPRQCDVGTAEEKYARFREHCTKCDGCISYNHPKLLEEVCLCALRWAQMPYEEGGRDA